MSGIDVGTPAHMLIEAVRTSFYRCELLPPEILTAVKEYEAANQPCDCSCHRTDDHCDRCCEFRLCDDCRAYSERA